MVIGQSDVNAIILDMDGVVTRTETLHRKAWKSMFDQLLTKLDKHNALFTDKDYILYLDGMPRFIGISNFLRSRNINIPEGQVGDDESMLTVYGLGSLKNRLFHELLNEEGIYVFEDTVQKIREWRNMGLLVGLITASRNGRMILQKAGIEDEFHVVADGNTAHKHDIKGKPAPDIFLYAASMLNASPDKTIVVEDAKAGVQAGKAGGFRLVVGLDRDGKAEELKKGGADVVINDMNELVII